MSSLLFPPGGPGMPPDAGPAGPPMGGPPPGPDPGDSKEPTQFLTQAAKLVEKYVAAEDDPIEKAKGTKILASLHQMAADDQKTHESAMGIKPEHKSLAKAATSIASQVYGG